LGLDERTGTWARGRGQEAVCCTSGGWRWRWCGCATYTPPSELSASPSELLASPSELSASPSELLASPSELLASPSEPLASPSELSASPSELSASPSELLASPSELTSASGSPAPDPRCGGMAIGGWCMPPRCCCGCGRPCWVACWPGCRTSSKPCDCCGRLLSVARPVADGLARLDAKLVPA
jgi:hypothetical protein